MSNVFCLLYGRQLVEFFLPIDAITSEGIDSQVAYAKRGEVLEEVRTLAWVNLEAVKTCLHNVAMQVAAMRPKYTSRDEVDQDYLEHEKEILKSQAMVENPEKPENIIEKMIIGRLNKEMKEICLLDQVYVQAEDGKQTVGAYVKQVAKEAGANLSVRSFVRFETGEGLEKRQDDFAAEVAAQMNG